MSVQMILLPLFVQVLLTIAIGILLAMRRRRAFATGTHYRDIALREPNWPKDALQAGYCYQNQFEFPVLFYVLTILALITKQADLLFVIMAWIFVVMRYFQAAVFLSSNHVPIRGAFFGSMLRNRRAFAPSTSRDCGPGTSITSTCEPSIGTSSKSCSQTVTVRGRLAYWRNIPSSRPRYSRTSVSACFACSGVAGSGGFMPGKS